MTGGGSGRVVGRLRFPGLVRDLPAGIVDAGLASLATFGAGLAGVNQLGDVDRGVYAVFFAAFMLASAVSYGLVFSPAEVRMVSLPREQRAGQLKRVLGLALGPSLLASAAVVGVAAWASAGITGRSVLLPLAVTALVAAVLSPAQDHVRRTLHIRRRSWQAAAVSLVQLVGVALAFVVLRYGVGAAPPWIPFGMLASANAVSLMAALALAAGSRSAGAPATLRELVTSGRWLLLAAVLPQAGLFLAANVVTALAGAEAMGFAEAARIAAQPVLVLGVGLSAVFGPRAMEAAMARDHGAAVRSNRAFLRLLVGAGLVYLVVAGLHWPINPMVALVPAAYRVTGLVALTVVAHILTAASFHLQSELLGGRRERKLTLVAAVTTPLFVLGAATAATTGAFARALAIVMEATARYAGFRRVRAGLYRRVPGIAPDPTAGVMGH